MKMKIFWPLPNFEGFPDFGLEGCLLNNYGDAEKHAILQGIKIIQATSVINYLS